MIDNLKDALEEIRQHDKDFCKAIREIFMLMLIYIKQIGESKEVPDIVLGLIGGLKAANRARKEPDIIIDNFDICSDAERYLELYTYLDENYN